MPFKNPEDKDKWRRQYNNRSTKLMRVRDGSRPFFKMWEQRVIWLVDGKIHWRLPFSWTGGSIHKRSVSLRKNYKRNDKEKGFDLNLIPLSNEITEIIKNPCHFCGLSDKLRGLDRINNHRGHEKENVLPACEDCNIARSDHFTVGEMIKFIGPAIRMAR